MAVRQVARVVVVVAVAATAMSCGGDDDEPVSEATGDEATATPTVGETTAAATTGNVAPTSSAVAPPTEIIATTTETQTTTDAPTITSEAPTTTETPTTTTQPINTGILRGGLLSLDEMQSVFGSAGGQDEHPPGDLLLVNACGSAESLFSAMPKSSRTGVYRASAGGFYTAYIGYFTGGDAKSIYESSGLIEGCDRFEAGNPTSDDPFFPVTPATAVAQIPPSAPANTMVRAFIDSSGTVPITLHEAYVQQGDYLLFLGFVTNQSQSEAAMNIYMKAAIDRFKGFVSEQ